MTSIGRLLCTLVVCVATPFCAQSQTIWGGFEDLTGPSSDYDYNDLVFSLAGNNLTVSSTGIWHDPAGLVLVGAPYPINGTPFWNNGSQDGAAYNIGYCIYGGGNCNGSLGLDPSADYLATATGSSVNDVYFSVNGSVDATIDLTITGDTDTLGWELLGSNTIQTIGSTSGDYSFMPGGDFQLVGIVNGTTDYYSDTGQGISQFAFLASPTPEPSSLMLLGTGLLGAAGIARRRVGDVERRC